MVQFLPQDQWDIDMNVSDSLTSTDEDDDVSNLWQTQHHDLALQDMPPLVIDSNDPKDDKFSFTSASQDLSENEMFDYWQVGAYNVTKLKITTPVEGCQPHP